MPSKLSVAYSTIYRSVTTCVMIFSLSGCAYKLGSTQRVIPGGYRQVSVPIFRNLTTEPGIEVAFTNALVHEFERSHSAKVVDPNRAEADVVGEITSLQYLSSGDNVSSANFRPEVVLRTSYRILMKAKVTLRRRSDQAVLWTGEFTGERTYTAPQVTLAGINSVNPLYNLSARRQNIDVIAGEMMAEAHDRISENF